MRAAQSERWKIKLFILEKNSFSKGTYQISIFIDGLAYKSESIVLHD